MHVYASRTECLHGCIEFSSRDLAQRIKRIAGGRGEIIFKPLNYVDVELRIPNVGKAREQLGFEAQVELDEGLERTIAWYKARKPAHV